MFEFETNIISDNVLPANVTNLLSHPGFLNSVE